MQLTKGQTCLYFSFLTFCWLCIIEFRIWMCFSSCRNFLIFSWFYSYMLYHWISYFYDFELNRSITISNRDRIIWNSISNKIDIECKFNQIRYQSDGMHSKWFNIDLIDYLNIEETLGSPDAYTMIRCSLCSFVCRTAYECFKHGRREHNQNVR